jgi:hypothetical protein
MVTTQKVKGFKIPKRTATLILDGDYEGAEVVVRLDVPVGTFLEIQDLVAQEKQLHVFQVFGDSILDTWNLRDENDQSIPANSEGMHKIPIDLANIIMTEWSGAVTAPPDPLD